MPKKRPIIVVAKVFEIFSNGKVNEAVVLKDIQKVRKRIRLIRFETDAPAIAETIRPEKCTVQNRSWLDETALRRAMRTA